MAGAHAAGARVGMDQLLRALGRLVQRRELGPQKLEVAHRFPLQDFPATTLLRANMTEPALGLQARGRTLHRAQSATDEVGHLRKRKFRLTPQQGQYLVGSPLPRSYPRFYLRFYPRLRGNRFLQAVGDRLQHELDEAAAVARSVGSSEEHPSELQSLMRISYAVFCL